MIKTEKTYFGQPPGLYVLFFTEMWERFSYYGMRALLVLYMVKSLFINVENGHEVVGFNAFKSFLEGLYGPLSHQALSSQIYGLYTGLVYFTPFFGGLIADRWLGHKRSIYLGGLLMAIGHFLMAGESFFFLALLFLILGNGFFKPNISTQVGHLYPEGDPRRDGAFTIFYMGINLGAFFSPLVCGTLGQVYGWHYGFGAAGIGMLAGLLVYHFGQGYLPPSDRPAAGTKEAEIHDRPLTKQDYLRVGALTYICLIVIVFWGVYEQQGNTLQLWGDQFVDWNILGWTMPSTWLQSFNPMMIFIFAPLTVKLWNWQNSRKKQPSTPMKMAMGCLLMGVGYLVMWAIAKDLQPGMKISLMWVVVTIALFTIGELYLSPVGLSLVSKLAPPKIISMLMGIWFLSAFFGNYLAGYVGSYYEKMGQGPFFLLMTGLSFGAGLVFLATLIPLKKILPAE